MKKKKIDINIINDELEKGNFDIAERIINESYNEKKYSSQISMPDNFTDSIVKKVKKQKKTNFRKMVKAASILICASVLSVTVYASTQYFRGVEPFKFGFAIGKGNVQEQKENNVDTSKIRRQMENEKSTEVPVILEKQNNNHTQWISKKSYTEKSVYHYSDDGINWDKSDTGKTRVTEYRYPAYKVVCEDKEIPLLLEGYKEKEVVFYEYDNGGDGKIEDSRLKVEYNLEQGIFTMDLYKNHSGKTDMEQLLITDKTMNHRKIKIGEYEWKLSDTNKNGKKITTTVQSVRNYLLVMQFENMQDEEVSEVLSKINLKAMIE